MATIELAYVQEFCDRHGRVRRYFRRAGCKRVALPGLPNSVEFMAAYHAALAEPPVPIGASRTIAGTVHALVKAYLDTTPGSSSPFKTQLGQKTCRTIEEMKAWSQNLGHEELMTTFASYGTLSRNQQADIMGAMSST